MSDNISNNNKAFASFSEDSGSGKQPERNVITDVPQRCWQESCSPEVQGKRNLVLGEQARALAKQNKFFEAISCLEGIEAEGDDEELFGLNLLKAECFIQLGRENKAMAAIREVKNSILEGPSVDPDLIISLGEALGSEDTFLRSLILFRIASDLYKKNTNLDPNEKVDGIARCISVSKDILAEVSKDIKSESGGLMDLLKKAGNDAASSFLKKIRNGPDATRLRVIILDFGIEYMNEMLADLRSINAPNLERKVLKEAWSATHIGFVLGNVEEFAKSYKIRKQGVEAMEASLGNNAGFHHIYSVLLHNMGIVLHNSQKYAEAKAIYEKTIEAKEMALDHGGMDKEKDIEETRKALEVTRRHILLA